MSDECKAQIDDQKDFLQQVHLESKIRGRDAKDKIITEIDKITGRELTTGEKFERSTMIAGDKLKNAADFGKQVQLEASKKARDTAVDIKTSDAGIKAGDAMLNAEIGMHKAKESLVNAFTPATKVVEAESTRGIDISHVENANNERIPEVQRKEAMLAAKVQERQQEAKRRELVDAAKLKATEMKESVSAMASAVSNAAERAGVALGSAAINAKESLQQPEKEVVPFTYVKIGPDNMDLSSVEGGMNAQLEAEELKIIAARKSANTSPAPAPKEAPGFFEKLGALCIGNRHALDAPKPVVHEKISERGVDVSSSSNPNNETLAEREAALAKQRSFDARQTKKAEIDVKLVQPAKEKLSELGANLQAVANKAGAVLKEKYDDVINPAPIDVHEHRSDNGVDITSIQNANNNQIGERIKHSNNLGLSSMLPPPLKSSSSSSHVVAPQSAASINQMLAPDAETKVVKTGLDGGVATSETAKDVQLATQQAATQAKEQSMDIGHNVAQGLQDAASSTSATVKAVALDTVEATKEAVATVQQDIHEVSQKVKSKRNHHNAKMANMMR